MRAAPSLEITQARHILFLGDSVTYAANYVDYIEAVWRSRYPEWRGEMLNLGLPSETVSGLSEPNHAGGEFPRPDLHERLDRVLKQIKPDLVFACYGMNDGIYLPLAEDRFAKYRSGMEWLRDRIKACGARLIVLTPPVYDPLDQVQGSYDDVLGHYSAWLLSQKTNGWTVLDIHGPMRANLIERRGTDPKFAFAGDRVHPNALGHAIMAQAVLTGLGFSAEDARMPLLLAAGEHADWMKLISERQRLMRDAWLTSTGHKRPGLPVGEPMDAALKKAKELDAKIEGMFPKTEK